MECEICGSEIHGGSVKVTIDGSELDVCGKCSQLGTVTNKRTPVSRKVAPVARSMPTRRSTTRKLEAMSDELVDDYETVIRDARRSHSWTQEQLAEKIKEKASLLKKIERGEITPEDSILKKLERTLDIKLTERTGESNWSGESLNKGTTLGDIVKIKRK
ncbi:MAG: multiprotein bridging factor aMBF1 [Methanosarcinaceae archaeon]|nr:multiprotein bridging factor aMBF1 [Methanosarcinaceae archaeon]